MGNPHTRRCLADVLSARNSTSQVRAPCAMSGTAWLWGNGVYPSREPRKALARRIFGIFSTATRYIELPVHTAEYGSCGLLASLARHPLFPFNSPCPMYDRGSNGMLLANSL